MKGSAKKQRPNLCLVGFSGSGKSSAGKLVAKQLRMRFADIDALIVSEQGISISEIFARRGERFFRSLEAKAIRRQNGLRTKPSLIAIGGGGFVNPDTRQLLLEKTVVIYLKCPLTEIIRRMKTATDRPLLNVPAKEKRIFMRSLLAKRKAHYEMAHLTVTTANKTITAVAQEICRKYKAYERS